MELRAVDPRSLKVNPDNPRRMSAGEHPDEQLVANIKAVGILQPPVVRTAGAALQIKYGHRRVAAAIAANFPEILVLVWDQDINNDAVESVSENVCRAQMGPVDQWRSIEALVSAEWTEEAIATALALPVRTVRKLRLLAQIMPAMLDKMALGDMPTEGWLRTIAAASNEEQSTVWKKRKPKKGQTADWGEIAQALTKRTLPAKVAQFGDELAQAYGIVWTDDLFAPAGEDARTTTQTEEFVAAQNEWLATNLPPNGYIAEVGPYGDVKLPPKAMRHYGKPNKNDHLACYVNSRSGAIEQIPYTLPATEPARRTDKTTNTSAAKPRAEITAKGVALIGDLRTDALHQALQEAPISDDVLLGMLVLALSGKNIQVNSGEGIHSAGWRERVAGKITEGGVLTQDVALVRATAREMLIHVLSCREDRSQSGMSARYAGAAIGADTYLPNMATQEFLSCLSKAAMETTASANGVAPRNTGKETRAAMIAQVGTDLFRHPAALFSPTAQELAAQTSSADFSAGDDDPDTEGGGTQDDEMAPSEPAI
jgi:ParB/RepB/Spo0J family partition protein